jgi:hypothetical protein
MTQDTKKHPAVPTKEELDLIRDVVLIPHMLTIAAEKRREMEHSSHTFKALYVKAIDVLMNIMTRDLAEVRKELKQRNIKVFEDGQRDEVVYNRFICRGYEERFGMIREVMRAEISVRFPRYMKRIFEGL